MGLEQMYAGCHSKHEACLSVLSGDLDTGRWMLQHEEFKHWVNGDKSGSGIVWLCGKGAYLFSYPYYTYIDQKQTQRVPERRS